MHSVGTPMLWGGFAVVVLIMLAIDQRTGISCVAEAIGPLSECVRDARLYEMVTVSENSISLHGYFFWKL